MPTIPLSPTECGYIVALLRDRARMSANPDGPSMLADFIESTCRVQSAPNTTDLPTPEAT